MFTNRKTAGMKLARRLKKFSGKNTIVLGLPRGGVITAAEVAKALKAPLDIVVTKKLSFPGQPEYGIGAVGLKTAVVDKSAASGVPESYLKREKSRLRQEAKERYWNLRGRKAALKLKGKTVIIVDDGMATGVSMEAAVKEVKAEKPARIIVAIPVAPEEAVRKISKSAEVVCLLQPDIFYAVGEWYSDFGEVTEDEVKDYL